MRNNVDLPQPLGPTMHRNSPGATRRLMSSSASKGMAVSGRDARASRTKAFHSQPMLSSSTAMEAAITQGAKTYNRYGSNVHKQVYIYGGLDTRPIEIRRTFGAAWGVGGWLVFPYLAKLGPETMQRLRQRVVAELTTTFASHYAREVSLAEALDVEMIRAYGKRATGEKYLVNPNKTS